MMGMGKVANNTSVKMLNDVLIKANVTNSGMP